MNDLNEIKNDLENTTYLVDLMMCEIYDSVQYFVNDDFIKNKLLNLLDFNNIESLNNTLEKLNKLLNNK